jgi:hypothetical protein
MPTDVFFGYLLLSVCIMVVWFTIVYNLVERSPAWAVAFLFLGAPLLTFAAALLIRNFVVFLAILVAGGILLKIRSNTRHKVVAERGEPLQQQIEENRAVTKQLSGQDEVRDAPALQATMSARRGEAAHSQRNVDSGPQRTEPAKPRRGEDVRAPIAVASGIAASGGSARVTLPSGRIVEVMIPCFGAKDALQLRLRGLGLPGLNGGEPGDALITVTIAPVDEAPSAKNKWDGPLADNPEATRLLIELAAEQGDAEAQYNLARLYRLGLGGLPKDEQEAERLFKLAADQGHRAAQSGLFDAAFAYLEKLSRESSTGS